MKAYTYSWEIRFTVQMVHMGQTLVRGKTFVRIKATL